MSWAAPTTRRRGATRCSRAARPISASTPASGKRRWPAYAWAVAATALCTLLGMAMSPLFELVNIAMVYLLAVVLLAVRFGRGPAMLASILNVAAFDFFFVPPQLTFAVSRRAVPGHLRHHAGESRW